VSFHTFSLPEDRCVRLLVKDLGQRMPENAVRNELESLNIQVQGFMQLRSGRRNQDLAMDRPPTPHLIVSLARSPEVNKGSFNHPALRSAGDGGDVPGAKGTALMQTLPGLWTHVAQLRIRASMRRVWGLPPLRRLSRPPGTASVL
jgi:hypothetical protein